MKILITGGAGFIGSHLVEKLLQQKTNKVIVLDDLSYGKVDNLPEAKNLELIVGSVNNKDLLEELFETHNFDYIFHLAAVASVKKSVDNPMETHKVNFDGTLNILDLVRRKKSVKKIVYTSSAAVYGNTQKLPVSEEVPVNPLTPYAVDKYASERYLINAYSLYGVNVTVFRLFNVFGERQNAQSPYSGVISIFVDRLAKWLKGEQSEILIFGDGKQTRDFVYVKDVVEIFVRSLNDNKTDGQFFNIGSGKSYSLLQLLDILKEYAGSLPPVKFLPTRPGDIKHSLADISKLMNLGYKTKYTFRQGLKNLLDYYFKDH